jgi:hypothetical protein
MLVGLIVVILLHVAARAADSGMRWSGVGGKDRIGWFWIWVQDGEGFPVI